MSIQNRYLVPNVSTANSNVGILGGNTLVLIAGSLCNKTSNTVTVNIWNANASANAYYLCNFSVPANSTITVFGVDQKHFLLNGDSLWVSCNTSNALDFIVSTAEGV
jgi:hypothetical protein